MDAKTTVGKTNAVPQRSAVKAPAPLTQPDMAGLIQRAQAEPGTLSPADILRLQGKIGNQAIMRLLDANAAKQHTLIQRDGDDDDDDTTPLLGDSDSASDEYDPDGDDTQSKIDQLLAIGTKMQTFYDMHKNYKKYEQYLSSKGWGYFKKAWSLANKVLGWVGNIDPTGISKIVSKVSKAVQTIASYVEEGYRLFKDDILKEQVTPLLTHEMSMATIKAAIEEAVSVKNVIKGAVDALT